MKYEVYLTKSHEVANLIARAFQIGRNGVNSIESGCARLAEEVPSMYHTDEWACCVIRYDESANIPPYRLVIA